MNLIVEHRRVVYGKRDGELIASYWCDARTKDAAHREARAQILTLEGEYLVVRRREDSNGAN